MTTWFALLVTIAAAGSGGGVALRPCPASAQQPSGALCGQVSVPENRSLKGGRQIALSVVVRLYLSRDLWVKVLATTKLYGLESAANVAARGDLASALGEGFADGLDVGGF